MKDGYLILDRGEHSPYIARLWTSGYKNNQSINLKILIRLLIEYKKSTNYI